MTTAKSEVFWGGVENCYLVGGLTFDGGRVEGIKILWEIVYWRGSIEVGGGMSRFLAGRGWTFGKTMMQDNSNYTKYGMRCNTSYPGKSALTSFENNIFITF